MWQNGHHLKNIHNYYTAVRYQIPPSTWDKKIAELSGCFYSLYPDLKKCVGKMVVPECLAVKQDFDTVGISETW